jgi:hypothetical protein
MVCLSSSDTASIWLSEAIVAMDEMSVKMAYLQSLI